MSESNLSTVYSEITQAIGDYLFEKRNKEIWSREETAKATRVIRLGQQQFYAPPPVGNMGPHSWSFMRPRLSLAIIADDADYDLPDDFGGFIDSFLSFAVADNNLSTITLTTVPDIQKMRQVENLTAVLQPTHAAVARKTFAGTSTGMRQELLLFPTPVASGTIVGTYYAVPNTTSDTVIYPLGGEVHGATLLASCMAAAEVEKEKKRGVMYEQFLERLAASIAHDRATSPRNLGFNIDTGMERLPYVRAQNPSYNGVQFSDYV